MNSVEWLKKVGLSASQVHTQKVVVKKGESAWLTSHNGKESVAPTTVKIVKSPEELQSLLVTNAASVPMMPDGVQGCHVDKVSGSDAQKLKSVRTEAVYFVYGKGNEMSPEARAAVVKRYFPLQVAVAALKDIEIDTGGQFVIDSGVGSYHFGTVKIHQGGNFIVYSNASITIDTLEKLPPN